MGLTLPESMAEPSAGMMLILVTVLVAWLPAVTPYDYNTCKGGSAPQTCRTLYSSHCCKSGDFLSATCCRNSCRYTWWPSSTTTCKDITESMCCSWGKYLGRPACCNYASYSRTSSSIVNGDTPNGVCSGGISTENCMTGAASSCCTSGHYTSATCCIQSTCARGLHRGDYCHHSSTYCCSSSQSCCDYSAYNYEKYQRDNIAGGIAGGVFGGIILLVIIIVVPVSVVCCFGRRRKRDQADHDTAAVSGTAANNQAQPYPAFQQLIVTYQYQPPPNEHRQLSPSGFDQPPSNGNQPPPYEHHKSPSFGCDQPPAYVSLSQYQVPLAPPPQPGPSLIWSCQHCPSSNPGQPRADNSRPSTVRC